MAFFCFRKKLPWTKTNYNCRVAEQEHVLKRISAAGAYDDDNTAYGCNGATNGKLLDKYGIDVSLDGSLKRSKKKKKKRSFRSKSRHVEREEEEGAERGKEHESERGRVEKQGTNRELVTANQQDLERARLPSLLDNATIQSPVCISVRLVHDYVSNDNKDFKVLRGETVIARFRKGENVFVQCFNGDYGFVPTRFCYLLGLYPQTNFLEDLNNLEIPGCNLSHPEEGDVIERNLSEIERKTEFDPLTSPDKNFIDAKSIHENVETYSATVQEQSESDSLARRIKKHEIRQLLKREASRLFMGKPMQGIGSSDIHGSCDLLESEKEPIGNGSVHSNLSLSKQGNSSEVLKSPVTNGVVGNSIGGSLSSLNKNVEEIHLKQSSRSGTGSDLNCSDNHPQGLPQVDAHDGSPADANGYSKQGIFFDSQNESLISEDEIRKLFQSNANKYTLSNRRCTSLRKVANLPVKQPMRANSLRYPTIGEERGVNSDGMVNGNGSLPRTPGSIRYLNNSEMQEKEFDNVSLRNGSMLSLNDSRNSTQFCNGSIISDNSIHQRNGNGICESSARDDIVFAGKDFISSSREDLSFAKGEQFAVIRRDNRGWWWVRNTKGQEGYVPCNFLTTRAGMMIGPLNMKPHVSLVRPSQSSPIGEKCRPVVQSPHFDVTGSLQSLQSLPLTGVADQYSPVAQNLRSPMSGSNSYIPGCSDPYSHVPLSHLQSPPMTGSFQQSALLPVSLNHNVPVSRTLDQRSLVEHARLYNGINDGKENPIISPRLVSLETQKLLESRLQWQSLYGNRNGRLAIVTPNLRSPIEEKTEQDNVESKEELLKRIRSEINRDPAKILQQGKNEHFQRQSSLNGSYRINGCDRKGSEKYGVVNGLVLENGDPVKKLSNGLHNEDVSSTRDIYLEPVKKIHQGLESDTASQRKASVNGVGAVNDRKDSVCSENGYNKVRNNSFGAEKGYSITNGVGSSNYHIIARANSVGASYNYAIDRTNSIGSLKGYKITRNNSAVSENGYTAKVNTREYGNTTNKQPVRQKLPSYTEYVDTKRRIHGLYDSDNQSHSSSFSDVSNLEGSLYETPRVLRRRKTFAGASKQVRFSQSSNGMESGDTQVKNHVADSIVNERLDEDDGEGIMKDEMEADLSTWC